MGALTWSVHKLPEFMGAPTLQGFMGRTETTGIDGRTDTTDSHGRASPYYHYRDSRAY